MCIICEPVTVSVFTSVSVSVCVSVSSSLVDYQWYLVSSAQHLVSRIQYLVSGIYTRFLLGHIMQRILQESANRADGDELLVLFLIAIIMSDYIAELQGPLARSI